MKNSTNINVEEIRKDFPILKRKVNGKNLVYFDNAATSQTPKVVIDSIVSYYSNYNSNIHRGVHALSQEATDAYEGSRVKFQKHFNAKNSFEIIFTSGATEATNAVFAYSASIAKPGSTCLISPFEHPRILEPARHYFKDRVSYFPTDQGGRIELELVEGILNEGNISMVSWQWDGVMQTIIGVILKWPIFY